MPTPSIGDQVMILPVRGKDLFVTVSELLSDAYDTREEDLFIFPNIRETLFSYMVEDAADAIFYQERWEPALRVYIVDSLDDFYRDQWRKFRHRVQEITSDRHSADDDPRILEELKNALWQVGVDTDTFVGALVAFYRQTCRRSLPPPRQ